MVSPALKPSHFGSYCQPSPSGSSVTSSASIGGNGSFRGGTSRQISPVDELDGVWDVRRVGGLLPPMIGVRKEISGPSGTTKIGPIPGASFDVVGLSLRYRSPFGGFVDELERAGDGYRGRSTFRGREFGKFELRRIST